MAASSDLHCKGWYGRQLDRLHEEAPRHEQTVPEEALRHLPIESLAEVVDATFKTYDVRASAFAERCLTEGNMDTFHAFIKAHHDILEQYDVHAPNHYRDMARVIGGHFIRKTQKEVGATKRTFGESYVPQMPNSPLSHSETPRSVLSWINKVDDSYSEPPPPDEEETFPRAAKIQSAEKLGGGLNSTIRKTWKDTTKALLPQRTLPPRKAKRTSKFPLQIPQDNVDRRSGRATKAELGEEMFVTGPRKPNKEVGRGIKRQRAEDGLISPETSESTLKRRKIAKPTARSKK